MSVVVALMGLVFVAVGGYFVYRGGRELRTVYHIFRNDPRPIRDVDGYTGPVEVEGRAMVDDGAGTVTAPFTGRECLAYTFEVEELRSSGKHSNWHTLDEGTDGVSFLVEDDTGGVSVEPAGADLRLSRDRITVSPGEQPPEPIRSYITATDDVEAQDTTLDLVLTELSIGNRQRFTERRLDVGKSVYVYGQASRGETPEWGSQRVDAVIGDGPDAPVFVISDTCDRGTALRYAFGGTSQCLVGAAFLAIGVFLVLIGLG